MIVLLIALYLAPGLWFVNKTLPGNLAFRKQQGVYHGFELHFLVAAMLTVLTWPRHLKMILHLFPLGVAFLASPLSFWRSGWNWVPLGKTVQTFPFGDRWFHRMNENCSCKPKVEDGPGPGFKMIFHNAFDGRT